MSKKDEALKKCLRVLEPIANERMYETQWVDSAIYAAYEALEEKEWQELTDDELDEIVEGMDLNVETYAGTRVYGRLIEQKLKEKNT